jgi:hypothetical protein
MILPASRAISVRGKTRQAVKLKAEFDSNKTTCEASH